MPSAERNEERCGALALDPVEVRRQELRYEDGLVVAMLARAKHAHNTILYRPAKSVRPTATTEGLVMPLGIEDDASFLDFFLREFEKVQAMMRRYTQPEQLPYSIGLPPPVLPLQKQLQKLRANSVNMNDRIKNLYENVMLRTICARANSQDDALGQSVQCDIECLQALSSYIHHAKFEAELIFAERWQDFTARVESQDADGLRGQLEDEDKTQAVLARVYERARNYGRVQSQQFALSEAVAQASPTSPARAVSRGETGATETRGAGNGHGHGKDAAAAAGPSGRAAKHDDTDATAKESGGIDEGEGLTDEPCYRIVRIFKDHILQLRLECQVGYLLEHLRGLQVAYLGPPGTYSHHAVLSYFGNTLPDETSAQHTQDARVNRFSAIPCRNVGSVFRAVVSNKAQFGVVPIENSHTGISSTTRDLLVQGALNVTGEIYIPVRHHLLSHCKSLKDLKYIYSHNQGFEQCSPWLMANCPQAELIPVSSTAKGAMLAAADPGKAGAICSDLASRICKIPVMAKNIMSTATNATRFLVLGHHRTERSGSDNTLMTLCIGHHPGTMSNALGVLSKHGNNICAVESFPDRESSRRCFVWLEVEGHIKDQSLLMSIAELRHYTTSVHILGSFPRHSVRQFITARTLNPMPPPATSRGDDAEADHSDGAPRMMTQSQLGSRLGPSTPGSTLRGSTPVSGDQTQPMLQPSVPSSPAKRARMM
jgi:chorismate mutase/prephenate dehydratase